MWPAEGGKPDFFARLRREKVSHYYYFPVFSKSFFIIIIILQNFPNLKNIVSSDGGVINIIRAVVESLDVSARLNSDVANIYFTLRADRG